MIGKSHPDYHLPVNQGAGANIDNSVHVIDVQRDHATLFRFKGHIEKQRPELFTVQNLRQGR